MAEHNSNRFDQEARNWDSKPETVQSTQSFFEVLLARIPAIQQKDRGIAVLDLGCGTGLLSQRLAACPGVVTVVGVDTSAGMIEMFNAKRSTVPGGHKMHGIAHLLERPDDPILHGHGTESGDGSRRFDLAVVHLALHHIPDMAAVCTTLAGTLRVGGQLVLSDFENDGPHALRFHPESKHADCERHGVTRREMQDILSAAGLVDIEVEQSFVLDKTVKSTGQVEPFPFIVGQGTWRGS